MGEIKVLNNLRASFVGSLDNLILLFSAYTTRVALILRSSTVGRKEQFFADILNPRYLNVLTFSSVEIGIDQLVSSIKNHNFCFFIIYL